MDTSSDTRGPIISFFTTTPTTSINHQRRLQYARQRPPQNTRQIGGKVWLANRVVINDLPDTIPKGIYYQPEVCGISILCSVCMSIRYRAFPIFSALVKPTVRAETEWAHTTVLAIAGPKCPERLGGQEIAMYLHSTATSAYLLSKGPI